jgi:hypothetical protein
MPAGCGAPRHHRALPISDWLELAVSDLAMFGDSVIYDFAGRRIFGFCEVVVLVTARWPF